MFAFAKPMVAAAAVVATLFAAGCKSAPATSQSATTLPSASAIACTKCQVTWVRDPQIQKGRPIGYSSHQVMVCPDCRSAVENLFATGQFEHTCNACGGTMQTCDMH